MSAATPFDFAPLLPAGLPAPAARWTGLAKYSFVGGNNDPDQVPVDGLIEAVNAVLRREGKTLATYGLASGPQGYRSLREFLTAKLKRDAGIACGADDIMIVSGSLQALDLVNQTLLARGDTVLVEQETYQGALNRLTRLGVKAVGIPLDDQGMRMDALAAALADHKSRGITPNFTVRRVGGDTGVPLRQFNGNAFTRVVHFSSPPRWITTRPFDSSVSTSPPTSRSTSFLSMPYSAARISTSASSR